MCFLQLFAELKQTQTKLVQVEQRVHSQAAECERQQQKIRELELELARSCTNRSATTSLQEELQAERARLIAADKKVCTGPWRHCWLVVPCVVEKMITIIQALLRCKALRQVY